MSDPRYVALGTRIYDRLSQTEVAEVAPLPDPDGIVWDVPTPERMATLLANVMSAEESRREVGV